MKIYETIKKKRIEQKMSQDKLADLTGYRYSTAISKIENGELDMPVSRLPLFAEALKCSVADLVRNVR